MPVLCYDNDRIPRCMAAEKERRDDTVAAGLDFFDAEGSGKTVIQSGVVVRGEIDSTDDIDLFGNLKGSIKTVGDVRVGGKVIGNIAANVVELHTGAVQGNITAQGELIMDEASVVVGNLSAAEALLSGKIKGDVLVAHRATFESKARLVGDVTAQLVSLSEGAKVRGKINVASSENDLDFDANIEF